MKRLLFVAATAVAVLTAPNFASAAQDDRTHGGADIGPLGQCFDPPDCGGRHATNGSYAQGCPIVRERVVTASGRVIFRRHRACQ